MRRETLSIRNICKHFGQEQVLSNISLRLYDNEIVFLVGLPGSGKSVLSRILCGMLHMDAGEILLNDSSLRARTYDSVHRAGIHYISGGTQLMQNLSIAENISLSGALKISLFRYTEKLAFFARDIVHTYGVKLDVSLMPTKLTVYEKVLVELMRAVSQRARVVILDGVAALFSHAEREQLWEILRRLKAADGILFVVCDSSASDALCQADRVVFLRAGRIVADADAAFFTPEKAKLLLQEETPPQQAVYDERTVAGKPDKQYMLDFTWRSDMQYTVSTGRITGLWCTTTELYRNMAEHLNKGELKCTECIADGDAERVLQASIISLHNLQTHYFPDLSVTENLSLPALPRIALGGFLLGGMRKKFLREELCSYISVDNQQCNDPLRKRNGLEKAEIVLYRTLAAPQEIIVLFGLLDESNARLTNVVLSFARHAAKRGKTVILFDRHFHLLCDACDDVHSLTQ